MTFEGLAQALTAKGIRLARRCIEDGDEAYFPDPSEPLFRRRASGAARLAARDCLAALGGPPEASLIRSPRGFAIWPEDFVGSLAHDNEIAVATAARRPDVVGLGIDVEPVLPLPEDVAEIALSRAESRATKKDPLKARAIFAAKEAVYKAVNPFDGSPLEYEDIEVDLSLGLARLRDGRSLRLFVARDERWIVVALAQSF